MIVQSIKKIGKFSFKVVTDETVFRLSLKNINRYGLKEGEVLTDEVFNDIKKTVLAPSAKRKAMDLLMKTDQSEKDLRRKLKSKDFSDEVIEEAVSYVKRFNYINDERYAENYVSYRSTGKSKRQIKAELTMKGIDGNRIEDLLSEAVDEGAAIDKLIHKKVGSKESLDRDEVRKLTAFLYRKGFEGELIRSRTKRFMKDFDYED